MSIMNKSLLVAHCIAPSKGFFCRSFATLPMTAARSSLCLGSRWTPSSSVLGQGWGRRGMQMTTQSAEDYAKSKAAPVVRPRSPFYIYRPQLTSSLSIAFRVTGVALTMLVYALGVSEAFSLVSVPGLTRFISELPSWIVLTGKVAIAAPFTYHFWNGIRHLIWDTGRALSLGAVYRGGYAVLAATAASTLFLVMI